MYDILYFSNTRREAGARSRSPSEPCPANPRLCSSAASLAQVTNTTCHSTHHFHCSSPHEADVFQSAAVGEHAAGTNDSLCPDRRVTYDKNPFHAPLGIDDPHNTEVCAIICHDSINIADSCLGTFRVSVIS